MVIRKLKIEDKAPIRQLIIETDFFSDQELSVAIELIDTFLNNPDQKDYDLYTAEDGGSVAGYICIGPTPLTEGTYDLYWIVVKPSTQNKGIGKKLIRFAEDQAKRMNGRLLVAETSSQPKYKSTCEFYMRVGYQELSRIKDYYKVGDDLIVYGKYL